MWPRFKLKFRREGVNQSCVVLVSLPELSLDWAQASVVSLAPTEELWMNVSQKGMRSRGWLPKQIKTIESISRIKKKNWTAFKGFS